MIGELHNAPTKIISTRSAEVSPVAFRPPDVHVQCISVCILRMQGGHNTNLKTYAVLVKCDFAPADRAGLLDTMDVAATSMTRAFERSVHYAGLVFAVLNISRPRVNHGRAGIPGGCLTSVSTPPVIFCITGHCGDQTVTEITTVVSL